MQKQQIVHTVRRQCCWSFLSHVCRTAVKVCISKNQNTVDKETSDNEMQHGNLLGPRNIYYSHSHITRFQFLFPFARSLQLNSHFRGIPILMHAHLYAQATYICGLSVVRSTAVRDSRLQVREALKNHPSNIDRAIKRCGPVNSLEGVHGPRWKIPGSPDVTIIWSYKMNSLEQTSHKTRLVWWCRVTISIHLFIDIISQRTQVSMGPYARWFAGQL